MWFVFLVFVSFHFNFAFITLELVEREADDEADDWDVDATSCVDVRRIEEPENPKDDSVFWLSLLSDSISSVKTGVSCVFEVVILSFFFDFFGFPDESHFAARFRFAMIERKGDK